MTTYDLLHAAPSPPAKSGLDSLTIKNYKVAGPQKSLQALTAALLSDSFPTETNIRFMRQIRAGAYRDSTILKADFAMYKDDIIAYLQDTSRPSSEIIDDLSIDDVIVNVDKLSISMSVKFASGTTLTYEMPVPL